MNFSFFMNSLDLVISKTGGICLFSRPVKIEKAAFEIAGLVPKFQQIN